MKSDVLDDLLKAKKIHSFEEQELINSVLKCKEKKAWLKKQLKASSVISRNEKYQHEMSLAELQVSSKELNSSNNGSVLMILRNTLCVYLFL